MTTVRGVTPEIVLTGFFIKFNISLDYKNAFKLFFILDFMPVKVGIIGGSGLEKGDFLENLQELEIETPYGKTSSKIKKGIFCGAEVYILSRHGFNHEI